MRKAIEAQAYSAILNPISSGGYEVSFPDFPGCVTFGDSFEEALNKGAEVLGLWIEELESHNQNIPIQKSHPIIADIKVAVA
jgi:predicted RNase H-like HicB family nuclease